MVVNLASIFLVGEVVNKKIAACSVYSESMTNQKHINQEQHGLFAIKMKLRQKYLVVC